MEMKARLVGVIAKSMSNVVDIVAATLPEHIAIIQATRGTTLLPSLTYRELQMFTTRLASGLMKMGVKPGTVVMSDLPNISENVILQIACNRLGAAVGTATNYESIESMRNEIDVSACVSTSNPLEDRSNHIFGDLASSMSCKPIVLSIESLCNMGRKYKKAWWREKDTNQSDVVRFESLLHYDVSKFKDVRDKDDIDEMPFAYFNSTNPLTCREVLDHGANAAEELSLKVEDKVCVSIPLSHAFGIGSACASALCSGSTVVLPDIHSCSVPSLCADATLSTLKNYECTILFVDTHTLKVLPDINEDELPHLKGGVCKIRLGLDFLPEQREFAGKIFKTIGGHERTKTEKEIRYLKKRLRKIERIENLEQKSISLNENQKVMLSKKSSFLHRLHEIEKKGSEILYYE